MMMRHCIYTVAALASALLLTLSCAKEQDGPSVVEGEDVVLDLSVFTRNLDVIKVKSWDPNDANERAVYNLSIYIFNESGQLTGYKVLGINEVPDFTDNGTNSYDATVSGIQTKTGKAYIYGIANSTTSQYWAQSDVLDIENVANSDLNRAKFLNAVYQRQEAAINPLDNQFLMTGYVNDGKPVTIARTSGAKAEITDPSTADGKKLKLYKAVSKNKLTVKAGTGVTFTPEYIEIHNVPKYVGLVPGSEYNESGFETFDRIVMDESTLNFYLPENLQSKNKKGTPTTFNEREKNSYSDSGVKSFTNAPDSATYIVLHGHYEGSDEFGNVQYTFHLGDFSSDKADFDVTRNYSYEYTITVTGANNFIAESKQETDSDGNKKDDPGSEGIVINTKSGEVMEVDCHYEARVMNFTMSEVNKLIGDHFGYILKFKTPFCESKSMIVTSDGIYDAAEYKYALDYDKTPTPLTQIDTATGLPVNPEVLLLSGEPDFNWVHFVRNYGNMSEYHGHDGTNHDATQVCRYPGTQYREKGKRRVQSAFEFLADLHSAAKTGDTDYKFYDYTKDGVRMAYVSCFIDENYYAGKDWTEFVNQSEDRMVFFANDFYTSEDKRSSYASAKYVISQKSIWTFYKMDPTTTPYGLENITEEEAESGLSFTTSTSTNSPQVNAYQQNWDGRASAVGCNVTYRDADRNSYYGQSYHRDGKQDLYLGAYKACMSRNRDENGDGGINDDEVKWYLAAIDQYKGIWAGETALPTSAKLFLPTEANWTLLKNTWNGDDSKLKGFHYYACSSQNILWAEEGVSTSAETNGATRIRCLRTLESKGEGLKEADKFYSTETASDGTTIINVELNDEATRTYQSAPLSPSYERGEETTNLLYKKFKVAAENISGYTRSDLTRASDTDDFNSANNDVCKAAKGDGWRVPNQRELSIMSAAIGTSTLLPSGGCLGSCTAFYGTKPGYYKTGTGGGAFFLFPTSSGDQISIAQSGTLYIRCVMDVKD